jgi:hypothetical protein
MSTSGVELKVRGIAPLARREYHDAGDDKARFAPLWGQRWKCASVKHANAVDQIRSRWISTFTVTLLDPTGARAPKPHLVVVEPGVDDRTAAEDRYCQSAQVASPIVQALNT